MPEISPIRLLVGLGAAIALIVIATYMDEANADVTVTTRSGTVIERVDKADAEEVAEALGRAEFMSKYADALAVPTVTSNCVPSVITVSGQDVVVMGCSHQFFDPSRLKVPAAFMQRRTTWADVANTFIGGTRDVALGVVGAAPYAALAYGINQTRKAGQNGRVYNDSFNNTDNSNRSVNDSQQYGEAATHDLSDHSQVDSSDNRSGNADNGSILGEGRIGDDNTAEPTVVIQPEPVIVDPAEPVIVTSQEVVFPDP